MIAGCGLPRFVRADRPCPTVWRLRTFLGPQDLVHYGTVPRQRRPRPWLADIPEYRAGRHASTDAGSLASNESFSPSPLAVAAAMDAVASAHRYPDPLASQLRSRLSEHVGAPVEQVLVGAGSDELRFLLATAYASAGGTVVCADPPYWGHEYPSRIVGATSIKVPLRDWRHDLVEMARIDADIA